MQKGACEKNNSIVKTEDMNMAVPSSPPSSQSSTSHMDSIITRLLVATKQLLEGLQQWSRGELRDVAISEIYVKLGNDFSVAAAAFMKENVSMAELISVPADLRTCLENCLAEEPSAATLDRHLPEVRRIIIKLLTGLKEKQRIYKERVDRRKQTKRVLSPPSGTVPLPSAAPPSQAKYSSSTRSASPGKTSTRSGFLDAQHSQALSHPVSLRERKSSLNSSDSLKQPGSISRENSSLSHTSREAGGLSHMSRENSNTSHVSRESSNASHVTRENGNAMPSRENGGVSVPPPPMVAHDYASYHARDNSSSSQRTNAGYSPDSNTAALSPSALALERPHISISPVLNHALPPLPVTSPVNSLQSAGSSRQADEARHSREQIKSFEALRAAETLSRRASKRYSAYAIQRMTQVDLSNPLPAIPTDTLLTKSISQYDVTKQQRATTLSPPSSSLLASVSGRQGFTPVRRDISGPMTGGPVEGSTSGGVRIRTRTEFRPTKPVLSPTLSGPGLSMIKEDMGDRSAPQGACPREERRQGVGAGALPAAGGSSRADVSGSTGNIGTTSPTSEAPTPPISSPPTTSPPLVSPSVFLSYAGETKKVTLDSRSIDAVKQLFVSKFDAPISATVYIRDASVGIDYELENDSEIREGSVLSLHVPGASKDASVSPVTSSMSLDASFEASLKEHIEKAIGRVLEALNVGGQASLPGSQRTLYSSPVQSPIQSPTPTTPTKPAGGPGPRAPLRTPTGSLRSTSGALRSASGPVPAPLTTGSDSVPTSPPLNRANSTPTASAFSLPRASRATLDAHQSELQHVRRELGVLRQIYSDFMKATRGSLSQMREESARFEALAREGEMGASRQFIEAGKAKIESETADLIVRGNEVQDAVDDLRNDTVRGVRPRPEQVAEVEAELGRVREARAAMATWLEGVQGTWQKTWERELERVITEQKMVETEKAVLGEFEEDLEETTNVLGQIKRVLSTVAPTRIKREALPALRHVTAANDNDFSDVLLQVRTIRAEEESEKRQEAIERAEKTRKEYITKHVLGQDKFAKELRSFVNDNKLKKSGGIEETERLVQKRMEAALKTMFAQAPSSFSGGAVGAAVVSDEAAAATVSSEATASVGATGATVLTADVTPAFNAPVAFNEPSEFSDDDEFSDTSSYEEAQS